MARGVPTVFVSYCRADTSHLAGRLFDRLVDRLGARRVFMDVDSITPGNDFAEAIDRAISSSDVVLVLIGRGWLEAADEQGRRRLDRPDDVVGLEVRSAIARTAQDSGETLLLDLVVSPDGRRLAPLSSADLVSVIDTGDGRPVGEPIPVGPSSCCLAMSPTARACTCPTRQTCR